MLSNGMNQVRRDTAAPVFFVLLAALVFMLLPGCATPGVLEGRKTAFRGIFHESGSPGHPYADINDLMRDTVPSGGELRFFAASPRMLERDDEIGAALYNAAVQAARYVSASGAVVFRWSSAGGQTVYIQDIEITDDDQRILEMLERLELVSWYQNDQGTYIAASLPVDSSPNVPPQGSGSGEPSWINSPPVIPGYYVVIGNTRRKRLIADSLAAADADAIGELIKQMLITVYSEQGERTVDKGTVTSRETLQKASGNVRGYYVLSRWISADGEDYYTLAVSPKE